MAKARVDSLLTDRGLADSRHQAQGLILAGRVYCGEQRVDKAGTLLQTDAPLEVRQGSRFVSRGGLKLEGALDTLSVAVDGLVAADIGASTGGFTDCLLSRGVSKVFAIDVGRAQLADKLRKDPRVISLEELNARYLKREDVGELVDLVVIDASFISVGKLLPAVVTILKPEGRLLSLVKPQFEAGRDEAARGRGVIRDENVRQEAFASVRRSFVECDLQITSECDSPLRGPKGNLERFFLAQRASARRESSQHESPSGG